jgi:mannose/cellobiose epimerase-like protein (N-acyl-D-glucosamine 2-epimerase family)
MSDTVAHDASVIGPADPAAFWIDTPEHRHGLRADAGRQLDFFRNSFRPEGGFYQLDAHGAPLRDLPQELFATTRMVHSYALGALFGFDDCERMIDHGLKFITEAHRDPVHGGYLWSLRDDKICNDQKLAYGHAFVLLAAASAMQAGHPDARPLLDDITSVLLERFWEDDAGLFADEANRDWTPFSTYRGFNANMHATEALLTAFEATGDRLYLDMAGRILDFFVRRKATANDFRIPEHYTQDWTVDHSYSGDPMFRPSGTTPGHSFELARLLLQYWDLSGRKDDDAPAMARSLVERALADGWDTSSGGIIYTVDFNGNPSVTARYWWPVAEAIGVFAALIKLEHRATDEDWYRRLWSFAETSFIDRKTGGWYPEIDANGAHTDHQFIGKPDIYHALQADLFPLSPKLSNIMQTGD